MYKRYLTPVNRHVWMDSRGERDVKSKILRRCRGISQNLRKILYIIDCNNIRIVAIFLPKSVPSTPAMIESIVIFILHYILVICQSPDIYPHFKFVFSWNSAFHFSDVFLLPSLILTRFALFPWRVRLLKYQRTLHFNYSSS